MSFILDALKKSESDRQRQSGPALFEVKVAPPRNGLPLWAIGLALLLAVNLVIVAWVLLRRAPEASANAAAVPAGTAAQPARPQYPQPQAQSQYAPTQYPQPQYASQQGPGGYAGNGYPGGNPGGNAGNGYPGGNAPNGYPNGNAGAVSSYPAPGAAVPASGGMPPPRGALGQTAGLTQPNPAGMAPAPPQTGATAPAEPGGEKLTPDDYAPAADAGPMPPMVSRVSRATASGVPLYQDAVLAPGAHIPELHLDLHVFATKPQDRFVMINMHKLREGDSTPEGVRVESITPEGAVLSKDATRFLLPRE